MTCRPLGCLNAPDSYYSPSVRECSLMNMSIRRRPILLVVTLACLAGAAAPGRAQMPAQDAGAAGAWQKLLKLRTTASAMHTTAHPDDEHGGVLAMAEPRPGRQGLAAHADARRVRRQRDRSRAVRRPRADTDRGAARRRTGTTASIVSTSERWSTTDSPSVSTKRWRSGARITSSATSSASSAPSGRSWSSRGSRETSETATATTRRPGWSRRRRSSWRATRWCSRSRSRRDFARGSR